MNILGRSLSSAVFLPYIKTKIVPNDLFNPEYIVHLDQRSFANVLEGT